nr:hypothetical protein [Tanacetum cinerariifolium]
RVPFGVIAIQRLFDPDQVEFFESAAHALRGWPIPLLVGVDHQGKVIPQVLANGRDAVQVNGTVGLTDLELDPTDALLPGHVGVVHQLFQRCVQEATRGVVTAHGIAVRAQETGQRQVGAFGLEVPERHVKRANRLGRQTAAANGGACPAQLGPQLGDVAGIL